MKTDKPASAGRDAVPSAAVVVLRAARKLITPRKAWTQGYYAHGASGRRVDLDGPRAVCWCSQGAVWKAARDLHLPGGGSFAAEQCLIATLPAGENWIVGFNDNKKRKHSEVLAWFDRAIKLAIAKASPTTKGK